MQNGPEFTIRAISTISVGLNVVASRDRFPSFGHQMNSAATTVSANGIISFGARPSTLRRSANWHSVQAMQAFCHCQNVSLSLKYSSHGYFDGGCGCVSGRPDASSG